MRNKIDIEKEKENRFKQLDCIAQLSQNITKMIGVINKGVDGFVEANGHINIKTPEDSKIHDRIIKINKHVFQIGKLQEEMAELNATASSNIINNLIKDE